MEEEQTDVNPLSADCGYKWCTNNVCGIGGLRTIEYCYGFSEKDIIGTTCGCTEG